MQRLSRIFAALPLVLVSHFFPVQRAWADWSTGVVTTVTVNSSGLYNRAVLDASGNIHSVHRESTTPNRVLYTFSADGGVTWSTEAPPTGGRKITYANVGYCASDSSTKIVANDEHTAGSEYIAYSSRSTTGVWAAPVQVTPVKNWVSTAGTLRSNDCLMRIAYFERDSGNTRHWKLKFSSQTAISSWGGSNTTVDNNGSDTTYFSPASFCSSQPDVMPIDIAHDTMTSTNYIVYYDQTDSAVTPAAPRIKFSSGTDNGTWSTEVVTGSPSTWACPSSAYKTSVSIKLDSASLPHIAYTKGSGRPQDVMYAKKNADSSWTIQTASAAAAAETHIDLDFDPAGHPVIAYKYNIVTPGVTRAGFTHFDGCNWRPSFAAASGSNNEGDDTTMVISTTGKNHILHWRASTPNAQIYTHWVDSNAPVAVTNLSTVSFSGSDVTLSWTSPADRDEISASTYMPGGSLYRLMYTANATKAALSWDPKTSDSDFTKVDIATSCANPGKNESATVNVGTPGVYYFRVFSRDEYPDNFSPLSQGATITMDLVAPGPVTNLSALVSSLGATIELSWTAPGDDGYTGALGAGSQFYIQHTTDTEDAENTVLWSTASAQITISTSGVSPGQKQRRDVGGLIMGATYYFRIWTLDDSVNLSTGLSNGATTWAFIDNSAPAITSNLAAAGPPSTTSVMLSWTSAGDDGASGNLEVGSQYRIQYTSSALDADLDLFWSTASAQEAISTSGALGNRSWEVDELTPGTTFFFRIWTADEASNWSPRSAMLSTCTLSATPIGASVTAIHKSSFTVNWTAVTSAGYELKASSTNFGVQTGGGSVYLSSTTNSAATSLPIYGLEANTTYYFRLASYNWNSYPSAYVEVSSRATMASTATAGQYYVVGATYVVVNWKPHPASPQSDRAEGYVLQAATAPSSGAASDFTGTLFSSVTWTGVTLSTLTIGGLSPGTTYTFRIGSLSHGGTTNYTTLSSIPTETISFTFIGRGANTNWYNAANWSPTGVPGSDNHVLIDLSSSVVVTVSSPPITFFSLTLGRADGSRTSALTVLSTGLARANSVTIHKGAGLTQGTTNQWVFDGNFTMLSGSSLTHVNQAVKVSSVNIKVNGAFDLQTGATVTATGIGYRGGIAATVGDGPKGGAGGSANDRGGGGGGHGGAGGAGEGADAGGIANDSFTAPIFLGSGGGGGGRGQTNQGSVAGGAVIIDASSMSLNGVIFSSGTAGQDVPSGGSGTAGAGGGSAGGAVYITAASFSGGGSINVSGGAGGTDVVDGVGDGGGGGGGRVRINITGSGVTCNISPITIAGGSAPAGATAGVAGSSSTSDGLIGPSDFTGAVQGVSSITWTWSLVTGATDYQVFASSGGPISSPLGAAVSYTTQNLATNTTAIFYLQVRACGANSTNSAEDREPTLANTPTGPSLGSAYNSVTTASVNVSWSNSGNPVNITSYTVALSVSETYPNGDSGNVTLTTAPAGATPSAVVTGLSPNTSYFLFIRAVNHAGTGSDYVSLGSTATLANIPATPADVFSAVAATSFTVSWNRNANPLTITTYTVQVSTASDFNIYATSVTASTAPAAYPQYSFTGLAANTTYYFRVRAVNHNSVPTAYLELNSTKTLASAGSVGITITGDPYDFESVSFNTTTLSTRAITVSNSGTTNQDYSVYANTTTADSPWTLAHDTTTAAGYDRLLLQGAFFASQPTLAQFETYTTVISTTSRTASPTIYTINGTYTGNNVPATENRNIWFKFGMPTMTSLSNPPGQQSIQVTIVADPSP